MISYPKKEKNAIISCAKQGMGKMIAKENNCSGCGYADCESQCSFCYDMSRYIPLSDRTPYLTEKNVLRRLGNQRTPKKAECRGGVIGFNGMLSWGELKFTSDERINETLLPDEKCNVCGRELFAYYSRLNGLCSTCDTPKNRIHRRYKKIQHHWGKFSRSVTHQLGIDTDDLHELMFTLDVRYKGSRPIISHQFITVINKTFRCKDDVGQDIRKGMKFKAKKRFIKTLTTKLEDCEDTFRVDTLCRYYAPTDKIHIHNFFRYRGHRI